MLKISIKGPSKAEIIKTVMADLEEDITKRAKKAAARHGGVTVKFLRNPDRSIKSVQFLGSDAAAEAAYAAITDS